MCDEEIFALAADETDTALHEAIEFIFGEWSREARE
jgi:hypothetical protein